MSSAAAVSDPPSLKALVPFQGRILFQSNTDGDNEIYLLTRDKLTKLTDNDWQDEYPLWSPDGKLVSFSANPRGNYDIFVMNADGSGIRAAADSPRDEVEQAWYPDGRRLAYTVERRRPLGKSYALWMTDLAGRKGTRLLPDFQGSAALPNFSPVAPLLAFTGKQTRGWDIFVHDLSANTTRSLTEGGQACRPHFSPDGRRIVYVSHEADKRGDIWVMNADGSAKSRLTERDATSDYFPGWSPDGRFVVFCSSAETMYAHEGTWALYIVDAETKAVTLLFRSSARDVFPDWRD